MTEPARECAPPEDGAAEAVDVQVRPPTDAEAPAARMLLPEALGGVEPPLVLLAVTARPRRILGAVALSTRPGAVAPRMDLTVVGSHRRRGVGAALVRTAAGAGRRGGVAVLDAAIDPVNEGAAAFLEAVGFQRARAMTTFEADVSALGALVEPLTALLRRRGRLPSTARIEPLAGAPVEDAARLYARHLGGTLPAARAQVRRAVSLRPAPAVGLWVCDALAGLILLERVGATVRCDARVLAPEVRGGWANALLMAAAVESSRACGATRFRFTAADDNRDTLKLAARCAADTLKVEQHYRMRLR